MFARIIQLAALLLAACTAQAQWHFTGDSTPTWEQAIARFRRFADTRPGAHLSTIGADDNGLPIHLFVLADGTFPHPDSLRAAGKSILWITNGIHPGEPDGVDASLLLAQALLDSDQYMGLLANTAVCIVPVYNVSGALQRSSTSRANQTGPAEYGFRANARNLDLNRDFIKADSRNTRSLLAALRTWDPDLYFETHVSNGADHQYVMELLTSHPDRLDPALRSYLSTTLKPALNAWMDRRGQLMGPYFETRGRTPEKGLEGFLDGPRYSSGHAALHHRIGILSETHMLKPYADRVNATFQLMLATLAVLNEQGAALRTARAQAREHTRTATHFGFNHRLDTTHVEQLPWKGYRPRTVPSAVSGLPRLQYDHSQPTDTVVPWMDRFVPAFTLAKPAAYLIPQAWHELIDRLELDGVPLERLPADQTITVTAQRIAAHTTVKEPFEGRYLHRGIRTTTDTLVYQAIAGDVRVPMGHATDRLAMEILEPRAADSFFAWGFFDPILQQKEWFSDYVFEDIAADLLASDPALRQALEAAKAADPALANDAWGQLYWVYQRSPYFEPGYRRVPVFSIRE
ncbi:MAG: hypothetical protein KA817_10400 [Flavobacteriales bacterium]|nr:hypothetical protein [Flavobacteriales bacterium]